MLCYSAKFSKQVLLRKGPSLNRLSNKSTVPIDSLDFRNCKPWTSADPIFF